MKFRCEGEVPTCIYFLKIFNFYKFLDLLWGLLCLLKWFKIPKGLVASLCIIKICMIEHLSTV